MARPSGVYRIVEVIQQGPRPSESVALSGGFNTLTRPAGAAGVVIFPDPSNTQTLTLKGVDLDTGLALNTKEPSVVMCAANVGLTAGGSTTIAARWFRLQ